MSEMSRDRDPADVPLYCRKCCRAVNYTDASFCPDCGSVLFHYSNVKHWTTANYDPGGPACKPWRESAAVTICPKLKNRELHGTKGEKSRRSVQPWQPVMKQTGKKVKKRIKSPTQKFQIHVEEAADLQISDYEKDSAIVSTEIEAESRPVLNGISLNGVFAFVKSSCCSKMNILRKLFPSAFTNSIGSPTTFKLCLLWLKKESRLPQVILCRIGT